MNRSATILIHAPAAACDDLRATAYHLAVSLPPAALAAVGLIIWLASEVTWR